MARPRVFVSSTYYDLKHVRSSLDNFIEALGYDSVLSEKGDIAYSPDSPLDESCYREATNADILVLVIGGRCGSAVSSDRKMTTKQFFERYDSITRKEYESASARDIPTYILIEANVYSEYHTFLRNKGNDKIQYAHVDSVNIFQLIEDILAKPRNNPVHTFERFSEIESWLREQWAGLFRELLHRMSGQQQIATLSAQVETLAAINSTLQRYLEKIVSTVSPDDGPALIDTERKRLSEVELVEHLKRNDFYRGAFIGQSPDIEHFRQALMDAATFEEFAKRLADISGNADFEKWVLMHNSRGPINDLNQARQVLGKPPFPTDR